MTTALFFLKSTLSHIKYKRQCKFIGSKLCRRRKKTLYAYGSVHSYKVFFFVVDVDKKFTLSFILDVGQSRYTRLKSNSDFFF